MGIRGFLQAGCPAGSGCLLPARFRHAGGSSFMGAGPGAALELRGVMLAQDVTGGVLAVGLVR